MAFIILELFLLKSQKKNHYADTKKNKYKLHEWFLDIFLFVELGDKTRQGNVNKTSGS